MAENLVEQQGAKSGLEGADLSGLIGARKGWCVSIYLPLEITGRELHQSPIRFKNLLSRASETLREKGMRSSEAEAFLKPVTSLFSSAFIGRYQGHGLCVFLSEDFFRCYYPPLRFEESITVGHHFHIKPLLPLVAEGGYIFLVLALGLHQTRLFRMSMQAMEENPLPGVPSSIEGALNSDSLERGGQFYTGTPSPGPGQLRPALFFGGGGRDGKEQKKEILEYFKKVDRGLEATLSKERTPLLLAGLDYLLPLFREASSYGNILEEAVTVNSEGMQISELHAKAWEKTQPQREISVGAALEKYRTKLASGLGGNDVFAVVPASAYGRVDQLFLPGGRTKWGRFDPDTGRVEIHSTEREDSVDLLDLAAAETLRNDGEVFVLDAEKMPDHAGIAAAYRY